MSLQAKGELPDQRTPEVYDVHGPGQIQNDYGGYVYEVDAIQWLARFATIGCNGVQNFTNDTPLRQKYTEFIRKLIRDGKGPDAVRKIKEISVARRNLRHDALLYAFAVLARSSDEATKKAAYDALSDVCRIPTYLFKFIKFCEKVSGSGADGEGGTGGTGWGRSHRKAVVKWYTNFSAKPEKLARLVTKYKKRSKISHQDILCLAHPKGDCDDVPNAIGFIFKYIVKKLDEARTFYRVQFENDATLMQVDAFLAGCDKAKSSETTDVDVVCSLIRQYKLSWEHCSMQMLGKTEVWSALLPHMNVEALIRNLGKMTGIGLFATGSVEEDRVVEKIRSINTEVSLREEEEEDAELSQHDRSGRNVNILHPYQILVGWQNYKRGCGEKSRKTWEPNDRIPKALMDAFYQAFETVEPTGKKLFLAVHMSGGMTETVHGSPYRANPLDYSEAAATMMMVTRRTEEDTIIKGLSDKLVDLHIERDDKLELVIKKSFPMPFGGTDCALPMIHAVENKMMDIDAFVIYTDCQTKDGNVHATEALRQYREYSSNPAVKMVVVGMTATEFTISDPDDPYMLDIVGFDPAAPRVISEFVRGL